MRLCVALLLPALAAAQPSHRVEAEKFRKEREARLRSEDGWLTVAGLFWLREGDQTFGSAPENDFVLPPSAPARCGVFSFHSGKTTVRLAEGVSATLDGKPAPREAELSPDKEKLALGRLTLLVHASGARLGIRLKDKDSELRRSFKGLSWFPYDEKWRLSGRFVKYDTPKLLEMQNVLGDVAEARILGSVEAEIGGKTYRLEGEQDDDGSFEFVFRDRTSGRESYAAARFLDAAPPDKDGNVVLDFNQAFNPPCAFNRFTTCPLPPPGNRLEARVTAGEKKYAGGH